MKTQEKDLKYLMAKDRVEKLRRFYNHLGVYILVNIIITGFKVTSHLESWDSCVDKFLSIDVLSSWTIWGLVLAIHFISVTFLQGWEERKIETLMKKELLKNHKNFE